MEIRQRKLKDDVPSTQTHIRSRGIKQPRRLKKVFILLIVLALVITYLLGLFAGQSQWLDSIAKTLGYQSEYHYAVIIDAGSSGSRVLAYKFRVPFTVFSQANLDLVQEHFEQSKPGLSSFADDPAKGAETIVQLIKKAEYLIPLEKRKSTPLIVRATAGLRLLPADRAEQLLAHVKKAISVLGYDVGPNSVDIMDGADEGIYIWYTVNLLHNLIEGETMAALDLGGGSTQITFQLAEGERARYPPRDLHVVPAGSNITLYTHSYLGLGLLAARYGVLLQEAGGNDTGEFSSVCVEPIIKDEPWVYANKQYRVSGAPRKPGTKRKAAFEACLEAVKQYLDGALGGGGAPGPRGSLAAMSFFYDVAADAGIIDVARGGTGSVAQYSRAAQRACSAHNVEQPWACLDLVYVLALLHHAYRVPTEQPVYLFKKVNGHEVSWALGLAYSTVMNRITTK
ncbi:ectonucleoside triphosphate diphosphohydrolase 5 isoform X2 [Bombyx mandarina]|uniref:Ectonucleoside triphosphate diphosphohydrolase 5 n=2 Tax=Bombyx TaxID=7090 RepID=A0A8R1WEU9_BOMMO|nr:ectonucleoside triphosphate diphosphohydrolase 5 isoform X2 [Bombyx mori]XP_028026748.1 ectonucleoside triphosphate diphosphohydrolase 5 isoform X2 [Bombyx mandarina]